MQSDRELEEMIDAAIPGYSEVEPPPGLAQRIVARSRSENLSHRRFAWQWSLAIPAIACLLILLFLIGRRDSPPQIIDSTTKRSATAPAPAVAVVATSPIPNTTLPHPRPSLTSATRRPQPLPKQDVFPSPTPPTSEEAAMIALTRAQAPVSHQMADNETEVNIPEVHIAELEIKPLPTLAEQKLGPSAALPPLTSQQP
jgi:hypothetical protein